jgi:hypothetical protein
MEVLFVLAITKYNFSNSFPLLKHSKISVKLMLHKVFNVFFRG